MNKILWGVVVLVLIVGAIYFISDKKPYVEPRNSTTNPSSNTNYRTYTSNDYGFEFMYPMSWKMIKEMQASSADYLPTSRNFVAIYPTAYPAQDFDARVDVYNASLAIVKANNPFLKNMTSVSSPVNGISWNKMGNSDYLVESNGKTYHVSGRADLTTQIVSTFKFNQ